MHFGRSALRTMIGCSLALALALPWGVSQTRETVEAGDVVTSIAGGQVVPAALETALKVSTGILDELGVLALESATGCSGSGQVIAVLDTGIDPLIPGFLDPAGINRISCWQDLTGEGLASAVATLSATDGEITIGPVTLNVRGVKSLSGVYVVGTLPKAVETAVGGSSPIYFAVVDPYVKGVFDSVVIDSDRDMVLGDEVLLRRYDESRTAATIPISADKSVSVVVAKVTGNGQSVVFGADLNGHGTALAAIAAGSGPGFFRGVSPKSQILAIKVIKSGGRGDWSHIEAGIKYALEKGADVVLIGAVPETIPDVTSWSRLQSAVHAQGCDLVLPCGNRGPGVGTVTFTHLAESTVVSGGYIPKVVEDARMLDLPGVLGWYPLSSAGPDPRGNRGIDLLAPAVTVAPECGFHDRTKFVVLEGTSVAAAYAAGALSLLREVGGIHQGQAIDCRALRSLLEGAQPTEGLLPVEQGLGRMSVVTAWSRLKEGIPGGQIAITRKWSTVVAADGVWSQGTQIGAVPLWLDNLGPLARQVTLSTTATWLRPQVEELAMPTVSETLVWVYGSEDLPPGFHSAEIAIDDPGTAGVDARFSVSVTIPCRPSQVETVGSTMTRIDLGRSTDSAVTRQFFEVPQVVQSLSVHLVGGSGAIYGLYSPEGVVVEMGRLSGDTVIDLGFPTRGLWQVALFGDPHVSTRAAVPRYLEVSFTQPFLVDLGITEGWVQCAIKAPDAQMLTLSFTAADAEHEWRYRHSLGLQRDSATTIRYPLITDGTEAISLQVGAVAGTVVKVYVYRFSQDESRWVEVAAASTGSSPVASLYYLHPESGRYVAYLEGYGTRPTVYAEIDTAVIGSLTPIPAEDLKPREATPNGGTVEQRCFLRSRTDSASPRYIVVRPVTGTGIFGVFERPALAPRSVPIVQILGSAAPGSQVRTIRAWSSGGESPLDAFVTIGNTSYQLLGGRMTGPVDRKDPVSVRTEDLSNEVIIPKAWPNP